MEAKIGVKVTDDIGRIFGILMENNQAKGKVQKLSNLICLENPKLKQYIETNTDNLK